MNAMDYWVLVDTEEVKRVCAEAGTKFTYFQHIANKRKRPSVDLARRMVAASANLMTLDELLFPGDQMRKCNPRAAA